MEADLCASDFDHLDRGRSALSHRVSPRGDQSRCGTKEIRYRQLHRCSCVSVLRRVAPFRSLGKLLRA